MEGPDFNWVAVKLALVKESTTPYVMFSTEAGVFKLTGEGRPRKIVTTVIEIVKDFIKQGRHGDITSFKFGTPPESSETEQGKRMDFYTKFVEKVLSDDAEFSTAEINREGNAVRVEFPEEETTEEPQLDEDVDLKIGSFEHPHQNLNESLWDENDQLKPEVAKKLLQIAQQFMSKTQGADAEIKDITFTGSLANYNYSMLSDIDLHILIDFKDLNDDTSLVKDYFNAVKALWNLLHNIKIKGYEVEVYVQDEFEPHFSSGVYSIINDEWIKKPVYERAVIDNESIIKKSDSLMDQIDRAIDLIQKDKYKEAHDRAIMLGNKIKKFRKAGLETAGEYSVENLAFKTLRNNGYLGKLSNLKRDAYDAMMSLKETK